MNIQVSSISSTITRTQQKASSSSRKPPFCSSRRPQDPKENGDTNGDKFSTDWDKAWSNFRKKGKKAFFSQFSPNKYVTWNPKRSNYPLSEEVDPIKRAERSNLRLWTSPEFTLVGAIIIVTFLLVYTIVVPSKWFYLIPVTLVESRCCALRIRGREQTGKWV